MRGVLLAASALAAALAVGLAWTGRLPWGAPRKGVSPKGEVLPRGGQPSLYLYYSGEHLGEIEPCGCARPQLGGIEQRAAMLAALGPAGGARVLVDCGNLVAKPGRQQEIKYLAFIEAMNGMGYDAAAIGGQDLGLGLELLAEAARAARFPLLAANLTDHSGKRPFRAWTVVEPRGSGVRVGIVGLVPEEAGRSLPGIRVGEPAAALAALRGEIASRLRPSDALVAIGTFDEAAGRRIAQVAGRSVVVIAGRGAQPPAERLAAAPPGTLAAIGGKGHHLGRLAFSPAGQIGHEVLRVRSDTPVPAMKKVIAGYQKRLEAEEILARLPRAPSQTSWVGSDACAACHKGAHEIWAVSRHARALETLSKIAHQHDPECVSCHVTGLATRGGFESAAKTKALARVGCEACHGPGGEHIQSPQALTIERGSKDTCRRCHTVEHDPGFDFGRRWKAIAH